MNRKNLLKLSLIFIIAATVILAFTYFFFHYMTDSGFGPIFNEEAQKPFVSDLLGQLGVLCLFGAGVCLAVGLVCYPKK